MAMAWMNAEMRKMATLGRKVSGKWSRETLAFLAQFGNKEALRRLQEMDNELEKKKDRILAFQEARIMHPKWKNLAVAEQASIDLYGKKNSYRSILDDCREFDKKHLGGRLLGG